MKPFRWVVLICLFVSLGFICPENPETVIAAQQVQSEKENVCFRWAFGAVVGKENDRKLIEITRDTTLKTGDQFKMLVELEKKCFVYLIYHGGQGEMQMLFPNGLKQFTNNYRIMEKYYIPQADLWFALDENVGRETFYLLASAERLTGLEALLIDHESADSAGKPELVTRILTEIREMKRKHKKFAAVAERPVTIGGSVRGISKNPKVPAYDISKIAVEIRATDFFSRTFTIEHE